ncbi:hypothetical protein U1769_14455 [Sphingomonas sp. ZT3P38]|uniref:hypothetical protein n=1 Tax=Parasphingomonas zepuensis TaxID=3096161 RepID=UPI002FC641B7
MTTPWLSWPRPPLSATQAEAVTAQAVRHRLSYASSRTRTIWEPRLARLAAAAVETELHLIAAGRIGAGVIWCSYAALPGFVERLQALGLARKAGRPTLRAIEIGDGAGNRADPLTQMTFPFVVAKSASEAAWLSREEDASIAAALAGGYPPCCAQAWIARIRGGASDPLAALLADRAWADHPAATGVMMGAMGFGPVRHLPCGPDCTASHKLADDFLATMRALGWRDEADWLADMVQWRARASVAAGVAQVETGAFRFIHLSDSQSPPPPPVTSGALVPEGAPAGLSSIFAAPTMPDRVRALPGAGDLAVADDSHVAAGFATRFAQRSRWSCILWEQSALIRKSKTAIHLGCGNGLLLELLAQSRPSLRICGMEADRAAAALARDRLGEGRAMIVEADWMAEASGWREAADRYDLVLVDPEPLLALSGAARDAIVAGLTALGRSIVPLASDRALRRFGSLEAMATMLGMTLEPGRAHRISAAMLVAEQAPVPRVAAE